MPALNACTLDIKIPKLLIQPLVENALIHGLETKKGKGYVNIQAYRTASKLIISVRDDGIGMSVEKMKQLNERLAMDDYLMQRNKKGMGLENINTRIKLIYLLNASHPYFSEV